MGFNMPVTLLLSASLLNTNNYITPIPYYIQSESYYKEDDNILIQIDPNLGQPTNKTYTSMDNSCITDIYYIESVKGKVVDINDEYVVINHTGQPSHTTIEFKRLDTPANDLYTGKDVTVYITRNLQTGIIDSIKFM